MPLNDDEMYYWVWSLHPAFGYVDHPPMVAWLIATSSWLGHTAIWIRLPFIICETVAALILARAAVTLGASRSGAGLCAIIFTLIPQPDLLIAQAKPDPPYLLGWALSLLFAARWAKSGSRTDAFFLGVALGATVMSRFFGWALVAGICAWALTSKTSLRRTLWIPLTIVVLIYAPLLYWNAAHGWSNFTFTLFGRMNFAAQGMPELSSFHAMRLLFYVAAFLVVIFAAARGRNGALALWTGVPMMLGLFALSFMENVETYWMAGPFTSLCLVAGPWIGEFRKPLRAAVLSVWAAAAILTMASVAAAGLWRSGPLDKRDFVFYPGIAADARRFITQRSVQPVTDTYQIAATLRYYGMKTTMIGGTSQASMWDGWYGSELPPRAIVLLLHPLERRSALYSFLARRYAAIAAGPALHYGTAQTQFTVYVIWCSRLKPFAESAAQATTRAQITR